MEIGTLNRMTGEGDVSYPPRSSIVEPSALAAVSRQFKQLPMIEVAVA